MTYPDRERIPAADNTAAWEAFWANGGTVDRILEEASWDGGRTFGPVLPDDATLSYMGWQADQAEKSPYRSADQAEAAREAEAQTLDGWLLAHREAEADPELEI